MALTVQEDIKAEMRRLTAQDELRITEAISDQLMAELMRALAARREIDRVTLTTGAVRMIHNQVSELLWDLGRGRKPAILRDLDGEVPNDP